MLKISILYFQSLLENTSLIYLISSDLMQWCFQWTLAASCALLLYTTTNSTQKGCLFLLFLQRYTYANTRDTWSSRKSAWLATLLQLLSHVNCHRIYPQHLQTKLSAALLYSRTSATSFKLSQLPPTTYLEARNCPSMSISCNWHLKNH